MEWNFEAGTFDLHNTGHVWRNDFEKTSDRNHGGFSKEQALVTSRFELVSHNGVPDCHRIPVDRKSFIYSSFFTKDSGFMRFLSNAINKTEKILHYQLDNSEIRKPISFYDIKLQKNRLHDHSFLINRRSFDSTIKSILNLSFPYNAVSRVARRSTLPADRLKQGTGVIMCGTARPFVRSVLEHNGGGWGLAVKPFRDRSTLVGRALRGPWRLQ